MAHDVVVKVMLTPEEYLAFRSVCDEAGLSQSAAARQLIKRSIAEFVRSSADTPRDATPDPGQE